MLDGSVRVVEEHGPSYEAASSAVKRHLREGERLLAVSRLPS